MAAVFERVRDEINQILQRRGVELGELQITLRSELVEDLGLDSLDLVDLIVGLEEAFGVVGRLSEEELEKVVTVGDAVSLLESLGAIGG